MSLNNYMYTSGDYSSLWTRFDPILSLNFYDDDCYDQPGENAISDNIPFSYDTDEFFSLAGEEPSALPATETFKPIDATTLEPFNPELDEYEASNISESSDSFIDIETISPQTPEIIVTRKRVTRSEPFYQPTRSYVDHDCHRSIMVVNPNGESINLFILPIYPSIVPSQQVPSFLSTQPLKSKPVVKINGSSVSYPGVNVAELKEFDSFKSFSRIYSLFYTFSRYMPAEKPPKMDEIEFNQLLEEGYLKCNVIILKRNNSSITYETPIAYDIICSNRFSDSTDFSDLATKKRSAFKWWNVWAAASPIIQTYENGKVTRTVAVHHLLLRNVHFQAMNEEQTRLTVIEVFRRSLVKSAGEDNIQPLTNIVPFIKRPFAECYDEAVKEVIAELDAGKAVGNL